MNNYTVIGIVQILIDGAWGEQSICHTIRASSRAAATQMVLDSYPCGARWHSPEMVRVERK
jgi:hypothetical protein